MDIETMFFVTEHKMEGDICRDKICMSEEKEYGERVTELTIL